jgi:DNA helicase HerA-like ATPase
MLVPEVKLEQRKKEYPSIDVRPVLFDPSELDSDAWHYLMGATGNDAMYVRTINKIIKDLDRMHMLTFDGIWSSIVEGDLDKAQQRRAGDRLEFAKEYIKDGMDLGSAIAPGRLVVVDLREKYIKKADAIGLFMILQKVLAEPQYEGERFNRLFVFDEAHNYMGTDFADEILGAIRLMRHHGNSVVIASQDPVSVPAKVIELSSIVVLHKMTAPNWLKHIKGSVAALGDLSPGDLNMLHAGQAYIWAKESNRTDFQDKAIKVEMRPRVTKHGGETLKAVS